MSKYTAQIICQTKRHCIRCQRDSAFREYVGITVCPQGLPLYGSSSRSSSSSSSSSIASSSASSSTSISSEVVPIGSRGNQQAERTTDSATPKTLTADKDDCNCSRKARQGKTMRAS